MFNFPIKVILALAGIFALTSIDVIYTAYHHPIEMQQLAMGDAE